MTETIEMIKWRKPENELPDSEETVLLFMPDAEGEPVWPGYFDHYGDFCWMLADGMPAGNVVAWSYFPEGPKVQP